MDSIEQSVEQLAKAIKSPQMKLSNDSLKSVPQTIESIIESSQRPVYHLKTAASLLTPSLIEKLGDTRDSSRELALEALKEMYCTIHQQHALHSMKERVSKDGSHHANPYEGMVTMLTEEIKMFAFGSKVPRVREQIVLWLVSVALILHNFALKPYVPLLVKLLEDPNEAVRAVSKDAIIQLYNEIPSKAMRMDIRKDLVKQGIRQSTMDAIISQFKDSSDAFEEIIADGHEEEKTIAKPTNSEPTPIMMSFVGQLETECADFNRLFNGKETEQNWEERDRALHKIRSIVRGNAPHLDSFHNALKSYVDAILRSMHSLRTALVITCCTVIVDIAVAVPHDIEHSTEALLMNLFKVASSSKKLIVSAASHAIKAILSIVPFHQKYLQYISSGLSDKSQVLRKVASETLCVAIERILSGLTHTSAFEKNQILDAVERDIKKGLGDANGAVRESCRDAFHILRGGWPERSERLLNSLEAPIKKAVMRHSEPKQHLVQIPKITPFELPLAPIALAAEPTVDKPIAAENIHRAGLAYPESTSLNVSKASSAAHSPSEAKVGVSPRHSQLLSVTNKSKPNPSSTRSAISQSEKRAKSSAPEEIVLALLNSANTDELLEGFYKILNIVQEATVLKKALPFSDKMLRELTTSLSALYEDPKPELILSLLDMEYIQILTSGKMIDMRAIIICIQKTIQDGKDESVQQHAQNISDTIKRMFNKPELFDAVLGLMTPFFPQKNRFKGNTSGSHTHYNLTPALTEYLGSLTELWSASYNAEMTQYFTNDKNANMVCNKLILIHNSRISSKPGVKANILAILKTIHDISPKSVESTLGSFDMDMTADIRAHVGIEEHHSFEAVPAHTYLNSGNAIETKHGDNASTLIEPLLEDRAAQEDEIFNVANEPRESIDNISCIEKDDADNSIASLEDDDDKLDDDMMHSEMGIINETPPVDFEEASIMAPHHFIRKSDSGANYNTSKLYQNGSDDLVDIGALSVRNQTLVPTTNMLPPISRNIVGKPELGVLENLVRGNLPPATPIVKQRKSLVQFAENGTPRKIRPEDELKHLLHQLNIGSAVNSSIRRLFQISRSDAKTQNSSGYDWATTMRPIISALSQILLFTTTDDELKEGCLLLLKEFLENQTHFLRGAELELVSLLLDCRSDGTNEVSGSAEGTLEKCLEVMDGHQLFDVFISLLSKWDLNDPDDPGRTVRQRAFDDDMVPYQPSPASSAFKFLGKLLSKFKASDFDNGNLMYLVMMVSKKGINCNSAEIRKSTIDCLVDAEKVLHDDLWPHVNQYFNEAQKKLLAVYVARSDSKITK